MVSTFSDFVPTWLLFQTVCPRGHRVMCWISACVAAGIFKLIPLANLLRNQNYSSPYIFPAATFTVAAAVAISLRATRTRRDLFICYFATLFVLAISLGPAAIKITEICSKDPAPDRSTEAVIVHILLTRTAMRLVESLRLPVSSRPRLKVQPKYVLTFQQKQGESDLTQPPLRSLDTDPNSLAELPTFARWNLLLVLPLYFSFRIAYRAGKWPSPSPIFKPKDTWLAGVTHSALLYPLYDLSSLVSNSIHHFYPRNY